MDILELCQNVESQDDLVDWLYERTGVNQLERSISADCMQSKI